MPSVLFIGIVGHNASGKTFLAKKLEDDLSANRINADEFRLFLSERVRYFHKLDLSYKNDKIDALGPLTLDYRLSLAKILLHAGEIVIYEGSGFLEKWRKTYLDVAKSCSNSVVTVLISVELPENELLKRLKQREEKEGGRWTEQYYEKKDLYEPISDNEADLVLHYTQNNYDDMVKKLSSL